MSENGGGGGEDNKWCTDHIKLACICVGVVTLLALISRHACSVASEGTSEEEERGGGVDGILRSCQKLVNSRTHSSISKAAGALWAVQQLVDGNAVSASSTQRETLDKLVGECRRKVASSKLPRVPPQEPARPQQQRLSVYS